MTNKRIEITIDSEGNAEIEAFGFKGKSCKETTAFLEEALGKAGDVRKKAEWYLVNSDYVRQTQKFGINSKNLCG